MIEPIKRIDLNRLFESHREEYLDAIAKACDAGSFSGGIYADKFDEEFATYCGVAAATGVNNGTSALHCAMMALGIGIGDEVIVPANTFIATAWGPTYAGQHLSLWIVHRIHGSWMPIKSKMPLQKKLKLLLEFIYTVSL